MIFPGGVPAFFRKCVVVSIADKDGGGGAGFAIGWFGNPTFLGNHQTDDKTKAPISFFFSEPTRLTYSLHPFFLFARLI